MIGRGNSSLMVDAIQPVDLLHPLNRGLVTWLLATPGRMSGPKWNDLTRFGDGSLTNIAIPSSATSGWQPQTNRPGGFGAMAFDGSNDFVDCGLGPQPTSPITVSAWLFRTSSNGGVVATDNSTFSTKHGYNMVAFADIGYWDVGIGGASVNRVALSCPAQNQWHFWTGTYRSGSQVLYYDGVAAVTGAGTGTITYDGTSTTRIGTWNSTPIAGLIDDVRVYNRALSASEVSALYDQSRRGHPDTLRRLKNRAYSFGAGATTVNGVIGSGIGAPSFVIGS